MSLCALIVTPTPPTKLVDEFNARAMSIGRWKIRNAIPAKAPTNSEHGAQDNRQLRNLDQVFLEQDWFYMTTGASRRRKKKNLPTTQRSFRVSSSARPASRDGSEAEEYEEVHDVVIRTVPSIFEPATSSSANHSPVNSNAGNSFGTSSANNTSAEPTYMVPRGGVWRVHLIEKPRRKSPARRSALAMENLLYGVFCERTHLPHFRCEVFLARPIVFDVCWARLILWFVKGTLLDISSLHLESSVGGGTPTTRIFTVGKTSQAN